MPHTDKHIERIAKDISVDKDALSKRRPLMPLVDIFEDFPELADFEPSLLEELAGQPDPFAPIDPLGFGATAAVTAPSPPLGEPIPFDPLATPDVPVLHL